MKIFVTGATGFIGSHFINLANRYPNIEIIGLKRSLNSKSRVPLLKEPLWLIKDLDQVEKGDLKGVDVILHLAVHSINPPYDNLENCLFWNVSAPLKMFREAHKANVDKFIVAGSCLEYGLSGEKYDFIPVDAALRPTLTYAASKAAASIVFSQFAIENKIKLSYCRIFNVFGTGEMELNLWSSLKKAAQSGQDFAMTKGEQIRDFISIDEVAEYFMDRCLDNNLTSGHPKFNNVGSGKPITVYQFSKYWWNRWQAKGRLLIGKIPYRNGEVMKYVPKL